MASRNRGKRFGVLETKRGGHDQVPALARPNPIKMKRNGTMKRTYASIFNQSGLMVGVGLQGSKITEIQP